MSQELEKAIEGINAKSEQINANGLELKAAKESLDAAQLELKATKEELVSLGTEVSKMKEDNVKAKEMKVKSTLDIISEKSEQLESIAKKGKETVSFEIKATSSYGDIDAGLDFAPMRAGITDLPKKKTVFLDLFRRINFNGEFYKYAEQETVVRDAQNVAVCSPVTSNTKETIKTKNITTEKIKDTLKFCSDYANDYPFVEGRLNTLIQDSVLFQLDKQLLVGTGAGGELNSISSYASEFDASNAAAPVAGTVKDANLVDLIGAMQTQIIMLGQEGGYNPDTVVVSILDWFTLVNSYKDGDNNYMNYRMTNVNGVPMINGMKVVTSPEVGNGTCYVFDSTKGDLLVNQSYETSIAFQNDTDWESDLVALKASVRANLLVETPNINAFMKCSDIATAITAITKV